MGRFARRSGHGILVSLLCVELALGAPTGSAAAPPTLPPVHLGSVTNAATDPLAHAFEEPIVDYLRQLPPVELHVALSPNDPALDADPFFLRAQHWTDTHADPSGTDDLSYETDDGGFTLALPGEPVHWRLDVPLRPLGIAGDYLWCAARDTAFFPPADTDDHGEGLFVVRLTEARLAARTKAPVPVFYFPLPDTGWSGPSVHMAEVPDTDGVVLVDAFGIAQPIQLPDVDEAVAAGELNLSLATGTAARTAARHGSQGLLLPEPKSTAGFGMLFTGFDANGAPTTFDEAPLRSAPTASRIWKRFLGIPAAHAIDPLAAPGVSEKLIHSLTRVGAVLAVATFGAVVLKYTLFRRHFRDRERPPPQGLWGRIGRELSDTGTVLAHNLTLLSSFAPVWFGNGVQYLLDRYLPSLAAGRNRRLYRLLDASVYFMRNARKRLPVNHDSLVRGAIVLGGVSSLITAARLYYVVPWVAETYARLAPAVAARINDVFHLGNDHAEAYARNETIRTFGTNFASGPSLLSESVRQQYVAVFGPQVDEELRKEGLDPLDEQNHPRREALVEAKLRSVFEQLGLPIDEELFNSTTLWTGGLALLGYAPPPTTGTETPRLVAADRPGVLIPALQRARGELRRRVRAHPKEPTWSAALELVESTLRDAGKFRALAYGGLKAVARTFRHPWRSLRTAFGPARETIVESAELLRRTRQRLFALTLDAPAGVVEAPSEWIAVAGSPGAAVAAHLFRRAYFGYLAGDDTAMGGPTEQARASVSTARYQAAARRAEERLAARYPVERTSRNERRSAEHQLLLEDELQEAIHEGRERTETYTPPKRGFFRRAQDRAAKRHALAKFLQRHGRPFQPDTATREERSAFRRYFANAAHRAMGLYIDYDGIEDLEPQVVEVTKRRTEAQWAAPGAAAWMASLTADERATFQASAIAENYAAAYVEIVSSSVESLSRKKYETQHPERKAWDPTNASPEERRLWNEVYRSVALAPGQPGRFQKFRRRAWVRKSPLATRLARAAEALFPVESHGPGLANKVYRNVPFLYDFVLANELALRRFVTAGCALYPAAYFIFGVTMPIHLWLLSQVFFATVAGPYMTLNRFYRLQGYRPMASYLGLAGYALLGGLATMWGTFPMLLLAEDTKQLVESAIPCAAWLVEDRR